MRLILFISVFFTVQIASFAQEFASKGDRYFYSYAYEDAIREYHKQMANGKIMTNHQLLNLADSYFKTKQYGRASKLYVDIHKNDTIMSDYRFNIMLQSLAKTSQTDKINSLIAAESAGLANELLENAAFNYEMLGNDEEASAGFFYF